MRQADLFGIVNGIDTTEWNPETDRHIPHHYSSSDLTGKLKNKKFLMEKVGLHFDEQVPLIGIVSRLVAQKGFDIVADSMMALTGLNAQWVILGSGESRYEEMFRAMQQSLPGKVWTYIGFNNELAHLIEAAADIFLMPSRYEPCGLNQMYSLRYGTVPVVRKTGGLADTVWDWDELAAAGHEEGNGFSFLDTTPFALVTSVHRALSAFENKPLWRKIQMNGMKKDFSWTVSAREYKDLYVRAKEKRSQ
jgi:starch synthase